MRSDAVSADKPTKATSKATSKAADKVADKAAGKAAPAKAPAKDRYVPRLLVRYREELRPRLLEERGFANLMQVPRMEKIVVNMGIGEAVRDGRMLDSALEDLTIITGQKPLVTKARKSIAGFKLRQGMSIGAKVTLRGARMWEFLDRLLSTALPRIRDFRGLNPDAFDGHGNFTIGVTEQLIFPEIDYDKIAKVRGMDITIVTTANNDEDGRALLLALGFPLQGAPAVTQAAS
jgi:large subunit ribosomal protein L5